MDLKKMYLFRVRKLLSTHTNIAYVSAVIELPQVSFIPVQSLALRKANMGNAVKLKIIIIKKFE